MPARPLSSFARKPLAAACLLALSLPATAATYVVNNEADLIAAINAVNASTGANFIEFKSSVTLSAALPPITSAVTIKGNGKTLSGDTDGDGTGDVQLLVLGSNSAPGTNVLVEISGLTLRDGLAQGAAGTGGGNGADGTGGALLINSNADVELLDVRILESRAFGGVGDAPDGAGGNGLGGGVYVVAGGNLTFSGSTNPSTDPLAAASNLGSGTVMAGSGTGAGADGVAAGSGIFLAGAGNLRLSANPGKVLRLDDSISDSLGAGLGAQSWNLILSGGGGMPSDTTDPSADLIYGTIILGANNNYGGDTRIRDVNVGITSMGALGSGGVVALDNGGLIVSAGVDVNRELVLASGGGRIGVYAGQGTLSGDVTGTGDLMKVGDGDLVLTGSSLFDGDWTVRQGALVIDDNSRLGATPDLILDGGGLKFSDDVNNLRGFSLTSRGGYIDNLGHEVELGNLVSGWNGDTTLIFRDSSNSGGVTTLTANNTGDGSTLVESGTVAGAIARGNLTVSQNGTYQLGGANRTISGLLDNGNVELGSNTLTIALSYDVTMGQVPPEFAGVISGTGSLVLSNPGSTFIWPPILLIDLEGFEDFRTQKLTGNNTYSGGTTVDRGVMLELDNNSSIGTGPLTLQNGAVTVGGSTLTMDINLAGDVGILASTGDLDFTGRLIGSADLLKIGTGTLTLSANNSATMSGNTVVAGDGSYVALANVNALGTGNLILTQGGGIKLLGDTPSLRPIMIAGGNGVIDTGNYTVTSAGDITSATGLAALFTNSRLVKQGSGDLILTGDVSLSGGMEIAQGSVQLGDGGTSGSFTSVGGTPLGTPPDISIGSGAQLVVNRSNTLVLSDPVVGAGELVKKGTGLLSLTGANTFTGGLTVQEGFVTGNSDAAYGAGTILLDGGGLQLASNLSRTLELGSNDGSLQVAGSDVWRFSGQLTGSGDLIKTGTGTLIYKGVADHSGMIEVTAGKLQVGEAYEGSLRSNVQVNSGAALTFARDDISGYERVISGAGNVVKEGLGELVLTGDHLFVGDLVITNGTVRLGDGGSTGSLAGGAELQNGSNLIVDRSGVAEISLSLSGDGNLRKLGSGELRLPGDSSGFAGHSYVDNGSIRLDGLLGGDMDVASGALLSGTGTLGGNLVLASGARLAAGNSIGTLTVGSLTLNSGSVLEVEVDDTGASDKVVVTGAATLAGELRVQPAAGDYTRAGCCTFSILSAGSVSGQFDQVVNNFAYINTSVNYLATEVQLVFTRSGGSFGSVPGLSWNQQQVSAALDKLEAQDPANGLVQLIVPLTTEQAGPAFDVLSGDSLLSAANAASRAALRFNHLLTSRSSRLGLASRGSSAPEMEKSLSAVRAGHMPEAPAAFARNSDPLRYDGPTSKVEGLWVEANGFKLSEDSDDTVGSAASSLAGQMLALGIDGYWSDNVILGFGAGYMTGTLDFDNRQGEGDATGQFIGSYGRWESGSGWHYKAALTLAQQNTDQKRSGSIGNMAAEASSNVDVQSLTAEFEAGVALHLGNYGLRPYAMLDAQLLKRDAIQESGAGAADLSVEAASDVIGAVGLGIELSRPWLTSGARWAQLIAGAALLQPFGDTQREQTVRFSGANDSFAIKATANDSAALALTFGGEWYLSKSVALWGGYEGRISSTTQEHNAVLSFQYRW